MSVLTDLIPGADIVKVVTSIIDKFVPDLTAAAAAKAGLEKAGLDGELAKMLGQIDINKIDATSTSWFIAGWRPFVGWVCGFGLAYQYLFMPIMNGFIMAIWKIAPFISLDAGTLVSCMTGLLGLGTLRTVEKSKDVEANR